MSRLGTEEEDRGDSQSKIFIDKIGRVFIETRYCQNKVRSRATHNVVQPRPPSRVFSEHTWAVTHAATSMIAAGMTVAATMALNESFALDVVAL